MQNASVHSDLDPLIRRLGGDLKRLRAWQPDLSDEEPERVLDPFKDRAALLELTGSPLFKLPDLARFLVQAGYIRGCKRKGFWMDCSADMPLAHYSNTHSPPLSLAELDDALHRLGVDPNFLGELKLYAMHGPGLELASIIQYYQSRPELLEHALGVRKGASRTLPFWFKDAAAGRQKALTLLADFPEIPVWDLDPPQNFMLDEQDRQLLTELWTGARLQDGMAVPLSAPEFWSRSRRWKSNWFEGPRPVKSNGTHGAGIGIHSFMGKQIRARSVPSGVAQK